MDKNGLPRTSRPEVYFMSHATPLTSSTFRIRYAECDAWGELHPQHLQSLFDSAVADAFLQLDVDWRQVTQPSGLLRCVGLELHIDVTAGYDDQIDVGITGAGLQENELWIKATAVRRGGLQRVAMARLRYAPRTTATTVHERLARLLAPLSHRLQARPAA